MSASELFGLQTLRIWDYTSGEIKQELYGHEHVVEAVTWAPRTANAAIRELIGAKPEVRIDNPPPM